MIQPVLYRLVREVRQIGLEHQLWSPGDVIVVAVSGGPDSTMLLHILNELSRDPELNLSLVCAHVNHGFRGRESDEEAEFVRKLAEELNLPFELGVFDIPAYMKESGKGGQEAAREKRYEFLHQVAEKYDAQAIALAHHGDDQAETVIMRLLRGSGSTGISGMRMKRKEKKVELIRPLLRMNKNTLVQACEQLNIPYVTDSSNLLPKYLRNEIRMDVLPFLGQYNEQLSHSLGRLSEIMASEDDFLQSETRRIYQQIVSVQAGETVVRVQDVAGLHLALQRRLIKLILNYLPLGTDDGDFARIEAIRKGTVQIQPTTWNLDLGGGVRCIREYDLIRFVSARAESAVPHYTYVVECFPAEVSVKDTGHILHFSQYEAGASRSTILPEDKDEAVFDADGLEYPLTVRSRLAGDSMSVFGMNGSKKVKDIFIDEKIPPSLRSRIPLIADAAGRIVWIPGVRRSSVAVVNEHTTSLLRMRLERD